MINSTIWNSRKYNKSINQDSHAKDRLFEKFVHDAFWQPSPWEVNVFETVFFPGFSLVEDVDGRDKIFEEFWFILFIYFWLIKYDAFLSFFRCGLKDLEKHIFDTMLSSFNASAILEEGDKPIFQAEYLISLYNFTWGW